MNYSEPTIEIVYFEQSDVYTLTNSGINLPDDEF